MFKSLIKRYVFHLQQEGRVHWLVEAVLVAIHKRLALLGTSAPFFPRNLSPRDSEMKRK